LQKVYAHNESEKRIYAHFFLSLPMQPTIDSMNAVRMSSIARSLHCDLRGKLIVVCNEWMCGMLLNAMLVLIKLLKGVFLSRVLKKVKKIKFCVVENCKK
jgi:hypothetical protein